MSSSSPSPSIPIDPDLVAQEALSSLADARAWASSHPSTHSPRGSKLIPPGQSVANSANNSPLNSEPPSPIHHPSFPPEEDFEFTVHRVSDAKSIGGSTGGEIIIKSASFNNNNNIGTSTSSSNSHPAPLPLPLSPSKLSSHIPTPIVTSSSFAKSKSFNSLPQTADAAAATIAESKLPSSSSSLSSSSSSLSPSPSMTSSPSVVMSSSSSSLSSSSTLPAASSNANNNNNNNNNISSSNDSKSPLPTASSDSSILISSSSSLSALSPSPSTENLPIAPSPTLAEMPSAATNSSSSPSSFASSSASSPSPSSSPDHTTISSSTSSLSPPSSPPPPPIIDRAYLVTKEIYDTEIRFVSFLNVFIELIVRPCINATHASNTKSMLGSIAIDPRVQVFFSTAIQISTLNSQFLYELQNCVENWDPNSNVGLVFVHYAPLFKIFGQYAQNHEWAASALIAESARVGSKFSDFIKTCEMDPKCKGQNLASLLIGPVQRVPRYKLLLEELKRNTPDTHPSYNDLLMAIKHVDSAAVHVNEAIRNRESREKLAELEKKFVGNLDLRENNHPRFLIREGPLKRKTRKGATTYYFHLFNDVLLYSEDTVQGYKLHRRVDLRDRCTVADQSTQTEYLIAISSPQKSFVVCFSDAAEKLLWMKDLQLCIKKLNDEKVLEEGGSGEEQFVAPIWTQDKEEKNCTICREKFTMIRRKHHCRKCGALVCDGCSPHRKMIIAIDPKSAVRVCNKCNRPTLQSPQSSLSYGSQASMYSANENMNTMSSTAATQSSPPNSPPSSPRPSATSNVKVAVEDENGKSSASPSTPLSSSRISSLASQSNFSTSEAEKNPSSSTSAMDSVSSSSSSSPSPSSPHSSISIPSASAVAITSVPSPHRQSTSHGIPISSSTTNSSSSSSLSPSLPLSSSLLVTPLTLTALEQQRAAEILDSSRKWRLRLEENKSLYGNDPRYLISVELFQSEYLYCLDLKTLLDFIVHPFIKQMQPEMMKSKEKNNFKNSTAAINRKKVPPALAVFFNNIEPIYVLSLELQRNLQQRAENYHHEDTCFGELFLRYASLFQLYIQYSQTHFRAIEMIENEGEFKVFVKKLEDDAKKFVTYLMRKETQNPHVTPVVKHTNKQWKHHLEALNTNADSANASGVLSSSSSSTSSSSSSPSPATSSTLSVPSTSSLSPSSSFSADASSNTADSIGTPSIAGLATSSSIVDAMGYTSRFGSVSNSPPKHVNMNSAFGNGNTNGSDPHHSNNDWNDHLNLRGEYSPQHLYSLEDLLRAPILRVSKYLWLLTQLSRCTPPNHKDYDSLQSAIKAVNSALNDVQMAVIQGDNISKLQKVEAKFVDGGKDVKLVDPLRCLLREGELKRITRRGATTYYFHLFNDALLYSEETVKGYKLHRWLEMDTLRASDHGNSELTPHSIEILSPQKSFVVCAKDPSEKKRWLEAILKAVAEKQNIKSPLQNRPRVLSDEEGSEEAAASVAAAASGGLSSVSSSSSTSSTSSAPSTPSSTVHAPVWTPNSSTPVCPVCKKTKFGIVKRQHHCRNCGTVCCDNCSKQKLLLSHIHKSDLQRVCDNCYQTHKPASHAALAVMHALGNNNNNNVATLVAAMTPSASAPSTPSTSTVEASHSPSPSSESFSNPSASSSTSPSSSPATSPPPSSEVVTDSASSNTAAAPTSGAEISQ